MPIFFATDYQDFHRFDWGKLVEFVVFNMFFVLLYKQLQVILKITAGAWIICK
jgi:hypothetical protein